MKTFGFGRICNANFTGPKRSFAVLLFVLAYSPRAGKHMGGILDPPGNFRFHTVLRAKCWPGRLGRIAVLGTSRPEVVRVRVHPKLHPSRSGCIFALARVHPVTLAGCV